jgi:hypothetical protein
VGRQLAVAEVVLVEDCGLPRREIERTCVEDVVYRVLAAAGHSPRGARDWNQSLTADAEGGMFNS